MVEVAAPTADREDDTPAQTMASVAATAPPSPVPTPSAAEAAADSESSDAIFEGVAEMLDQPSTTASSHANPEASTVDAMSGRFSDGVAVNKWRGWALVGGASTLALVMMVAIGYALFGGREPVEMAQFEVPQSEPEGEVAAEKSQPPKAKPEEKASENQQPTAESTEEPPDTPPSTESMTDAEAAQGASADAEQQMPAGEGRIAEEKPATDEEANPFLFEESPTAPSPAMAGGKTSSEGATAEKQKSILELKDDPLYEVFGESFPVFDPEMFEQSALSKVDTPADVPSAALPELPMTPEPVPPMPAVDVAARLRDPIVRVELDSTPLNQFASFVTQMSTVPVTLDPAALAYADISPTSPVVVKQSQTSVQGILEAAVRPFGLGVTATDSGARLRIQPPVDGKLRTARLQCDDLAENDKQVAELAYLLTRLVEPRSWKYAGGPGLHRTDPDAIMVSQNELAHYQSIMFFDKLRIARGLSPRSQYSKTRFDLTHRSVQVASALAQEVQVQIVVPTPLFNVVDQLEKSSGLTILCDWDSLAINKLGPATPVTLSAQNIPIKDALRQLEHSWKVAIVPIDATTVQLVAEQSLAVRPWLEFYDLSQLELGRAEATALVNDAKRELSDLRKTGYGDVLYDSGSKHLLALLSKDDHQRLQLLLNRRVSR